MKKIFYKTLFCHWAPRHTSAQTLILFQHLSSRTTPAISIPIASQHIAAYFLVLIALPGSLDLAWILKAIICSVKSIPSIFLVFLVIVFYSDHMSKNLTSINSSPQKRIIWKLIVIIPSQLRCHKIGHMELFHNLRQGCTVPKYVRKPKYLIRQCV